MDLQNLRPLQGRMLVRRTPKKEVTAGGIIIPETAQAQNQEGVIVAMGRLEALAGDPLKVGDRVFFSRHAEAVEAKGDDSSPFVSTRMNKVGRGHAVDEFVVVWEDDVLAVVEAD